MNTAHLAAGIVAVLVAALLASWFLLPLTPQTIVAPSFTRCASSYVQVRMTDGSISKQQIDELIFQHSTSLLSDCSLWRDKLRNGMSVPILEAATFAGHDIRSYLQLVHYSRPIEGWVSGVSVPDRASLRQHLYDAYGIDDQHYDYIVQLRFFEGSCNSDGDCAGDEYCMLADNACTALSCDDGEVCTLDTAEGHGCVHTDIEGCCHTDSDCPEDKVCVSNVCTEGCRNIPEKPCEQATFIDHPTCDWDSTPCQIHDWAMIFIFTFIAAVIVVSGVAVWWLRRK